MGFTVHVSCEKINVKHIVFKGEFDKNKENIVCDQQWLLHLPMFWNQSSTQAAAKVASKFSEERGGEQCNFLLVWGGLHRICRTSKAGGINSPRLNG